MVPNGARKIVRKKNSSGRKKPFIQSSDIISAEIKNNSLKTDTELLQAISLQYLCPKIKNCSFFALDNNGSGALKRIYYSENTCED